jgi:hypothetical protein
MDWFKITFWVYMIVSFLGFAFITSSILELERQILNLEHKFRQRKGKGL